MPDQPKQKKTENAKQVASNKADAENLPLDTDTSTIPEVQPENYPASALDDVLRLLHDPNQIPEIFTPQVLKPIKITRTQTKSKKRKKPSTELTPAPERNKWGEEELEALVEGMSVHGTKWSCILKDHGANGIKDTRLEKRSQYQLKDKARTEKEARLRKNENLGVFQLACSRGERKYRKTK